MSIDGRTNEPGKKRMCLKRFALEFGMVLNRDEPWMIRILDHFNQLFVGTGSSEPESSRFELPAISIVKFVAMSMPFVDGVSPVRIGGDAAGKQSGWLRA